ncbi:restriction endonuclease subunit S [Helicobacter pylori]|uniref:restriction endonuclease subunit S n=1 Tax=Helicobacter pylori TaxID=210 RepID=UPI0018D0C14F|nr:restriction endonuclease subunit S [Helicobacter pylori]MBH0267957.1 restriction endonuclease subunit S [Helicobacter pylori]MBH0275203.1 restriction endonuclease subunit S [Helicobacter pylori]
MSEWQTFCLKDLVRIFGGSTPPTNNPKNYGNKIRWITAKDLSTLQGRYIKKGSRSISRLGFKSCSTFLLPKHAILFSVRAPIGYTAIISKRSCTDRGLMGLVPNKKIYFEFLYYLLKYHKDNISNMGVGTTFKGISKPALGLFKVKIPPTYHEQQKIARTPSVLDQKIENNHKINEFLHKILELLYEQYFVRFDFLDENNKPYQTNGGKMKFSKELNRLIPNDFEVKTLGELTKLKVGNKNANHSSNHGNYPFFTCSNNPLKCETYQFEGKHIIISGNGNFYVTHYDGKFDAYQRTYVVNPNNPNHYVLIYLFVKSYTNYLKLQSRGSIIKFITKSDIENIKIILPNLKTYTKWNNILKMIENNMQATQTLTTMRDFLLPLLLKQQVKPQ